VRAALLLVFAAAVPGALSASPVPRMQVPAVPDSVVADTLAAPQDTVLAVPGAVVGDTLAGDSLAADSVIVFVPRNLAASPYGAVPGWTTGVWEWDREGLGSTRALTLLELLEDIPGVVPLRGGDFGQPSSASAFAGGAGDIRVFLDGAELPPLDGGVVDLSRVGIAGLERVRVERGPGHIRVELHSIRFVDPRPLSYLEVGTGDFDTNLFRGLFAHPNALGGTVTVALDRIDTGGPQGNEPGVSFGAHIRHALFPLDGLGISWELRRMTSERPPEIWEPAEVARTEWGVRARYEAAPWMRVGLFYQRSSLGVDEDDEAEPEAPLVNEEARSQVGVQLFLERGPWWAEAEYRELGGPGWPSSGQSLSGGITRPEIGGASFRIERQSWSDATPMSFHARAWSRPFYGLSLFGEVEDGDWGVPFWVAPEPADDGEEPPEPQGPLPPLSVTERRAMRGGGEFRSGGFFVGAAALAIEVDSLHPVGLPTDRGGSVAPGGNRQGFEASAGVPLSFVLDGLSAVGSLQVWNADEEWRYLPDRIYQSRLAFHDTFFPSQNLEVWVDLGVRGRDPMLVPVLADTGPGFEEVPFQQSWFGRLQIRVASARVFVLWDNFTLRPENQDYPGRLLPQTRAMYGIRWTMWN
jgi:hypothetical protein